MPKKSDNSEIDVIVGKNVYFLGRKRVKVDSSTPIPKMYRQAIDFLCKLEKKEKEERRQKKNRRKGVLPSPDPVEPEKTVFSKKSDTGMKKDAANID